jgi:serine/threonine-protein kinase
VLSDSVYERRSSDIFAVQDELTRAMVAALAPSLGDRTASTVVDVKRGTSDEEAYELYLKGHYYWVQRGADNLTRSVGYFRQAIARDPSFARAHAGLSLAYAVLPNFVPDPADSLPRLAIASAERAVSLDSTNADAQVVLGMMRDAQLRFREGEARFRRAVALDGSNATVHHLLGMSLLNTNHIDEAIVELRRALQADPLMLSPSAGLSTALLFARRFPEAKAAARHALTLDSTFHYAIMTLGLAQALSGEPDSAIATLERGVRLHPGDSRMYGRLLFAYAAAGRWADAARVRDQIRRPGADQFDGLQAGIADAIFGDREPLLRALTSDAGLKRFEKVGGILGCEPMFDPLWSDARFRDKMHALGVEQCTFVRPWPIQARAAVR